MFKSFARYLLLPLALLAAGCSGGGDDENLRFYLTDAPAPGIRAVNVTVTAVSVHQSAAAGAAEAGWRQIPVTAAMPVDLLTLRGGVLLQLCGVDLAPGSYQQVRLDLKPNAGSAPPYENSVVTDDGVEHPADVPAAGVKIAHGFSVVDGTLTEIVLDFDADKSVKQRGNGDYFLEPWITAVTR